MLAVGRSLLLGLGFSSRHAAIRHERAIQAVQGITNKVVRLSKPVRLTISIRHNSCITYASLCINHSAGSFDIRLCRAAVDASALGSIETAFLIAIQDFWMLCGAPWYCIQDSNYWADSYCTAV